MSRHFSSSNSCFKNKVARDTLIIRISLFPIFRITGQLNKIIHSNLQYHSAVHYELWVIFILLHFTWQRYIYIKNQKYNLCNTDVILTLATTDQYIFRLLGFIHFKWPSTSCWTTFKKSEIFLYNNTDMIEVQNDYYFNFLNFICARWPSLFHSVQQSSHI